MNREDPAASTKWTHVEFEKEPVEEFKDFWKILPIVLEESTGIYPKFTKENQKMITPCNGLDMDLEILTCDLAKRLKSAPTPWHLEAMPIWWYDF